MESGGLAAEAIVPCGTCAVGFTTSRIFCVVAQAPHGTQHDPDDLESRGQLPPGTVFSFGQHREFKTWPFHFCLLTLKSKLQIGRPGPYTPGKSCAPHARAPHDSQLLRGSLRTRASLIKFVRLR